jgi:hypothetical protein
VSLKRVSELLRNPNRTSADITEAETLVVAHIRKSKAKMVRDDRRQAFLDRLLCPAAMIWYPFCGYVLAGWYWLADQVRPVHDRIVLAIGPVIRAVRKPGAPRR